MTSRRPKSRRPVLTGAPSFLHEMLSLTSGLEEEGRKDVRGGGVVGGEASGAKNAFFKFLVWVYIPFQGYTAPGERRSTSVSLIKPLNRR